MTRSAPFQKYRAPVKGEGGALINLSGTLRTRKGTAAVFDTASRAQIRLSVDHISWPAAKSGRMIFDITEAKVVDFRAGAIFMEAQEVVVGSLPDTDVKDPKRRK